MTQPSHHDQPPRPIVFHGDVGTIAGLLITGTDMRRIIALHAIALMLAGTPPEEAVEAAQADVDQLLRLVQEGSA